MKSKMIQITRVMVATMLLTVSFTACKKDGQEALKEPTAEHLEIGTANNKRGLIGRDFHFNADVVAGSKIAEVQVKILPKSGETYPAAWKLELVWNEYAGSKNTNVHKHFNIPKEAVEGKYDFYFIVLDENGTKLEIKEEFTIVDPANMPVDPLIGRDMISRNETMIYSMGEWIEKELILKKGDKLTAHAQVSQIMGDGILYSVLIKKKANYHPETIDNLDFNKVIVITKVEHKGLGPASKVATLNKINGVWGGEQILIGADTDFNAPVANPITGEKAWESGQYNWVVLYKNTTHNMSVYKSIPITIDYQ